VQTKWGADPGHKDWVSQVSHNRGVLVAGLVPLGYMIPSLRWWQTPGSYW
jgi:hypothetical protein